MYEDFQKEYKKWVDTVEAVVKGNQFWAEHMISTMRHFFKAK